MARWRQVQSTNCKVLIGLRGSVDLELRLRDMRQSERRKVCAGQSLFCTASENKSPPFRHLCTSQQCACADFFFWIFTTHTGAHKRVQSEVPLEHVSLQLPWAVAFIAAGIGGDVNKVVGGGEMTLLAKTIGKEASVEGGQRAREARGDSQPINTHSCQMPHVKEEKLYLYFPVFWIFCTAYPLPLALEIKKRYKSF